MFQRYYKIIGKTTRTFGITAGAVVLLINLLFDYIFLIVFLSAFTVIEYVLEIGISYIVIIPLINWLIGRRHLK
jgi:predicted membrane protein